MRHGLGSRTADGWMHTPDSTETLAWVKELKVA